MPIQTKFCFSFQEAPGTWTLVLWILYQGGEQNANEWAHLLELTDPQTLILLLYSGPLSPSSTPLLPQAREGLLPFLQERSVGICTLSSYLLEGAWWWHFISLARFSSQICPLFINMRDSFRILGHLRSQGFAGEESLRKRFSDFLKV